MFRSPIIPHRRAEPRTDALKLKYIIRLVPIKELERNITMKKNLLSILILVLLIVNIVMTSIMMFSITGMVRKTSALVTDISSVVKLETMEGVTEEPVASVSMSDTDVYDIADQMMIELKPGEDGKSHYYMVSVSLSLNMKDKGYDTYGATLSTKESLIKGIITDVISSYTMEEIQGNKEAIRQEILEKIQKDFDSKFIYQVTFREDIVQ